MIKLGTFDEDDAIDLADMLKNAGIKVEMREYTHVLLLKKWFLEGRLSQIKETEEDLSKCESDLDDLREVLKEAKTLGEVLSLFDYKRAPKQDALDQDLHAILGIDDEEMGEVSEFLEEGPMEGEVPQEMRSEEEMEEEEEGDLDEAAADETSTVKEDLTKDSPFDLEEACDCLMSLAFINNVLKINGIFPRGDKIGLPDDPIISIPIKIEKYGHDHELVRYFSDVYFQKKLDVSIDELSVISIDDLDPICEEDYPSQLFDIRAFQILMKGLLDKLSEGKLNMEEFRAACQVEKEVDKGTLSISARAIADDLIMGMEKKGIIKVKKGEIRLLGHLEDGRLQRSRMGRQRS
ncbi:MAG: hypothetical protein JW986_09245 [Methanotrichaceae archaeon]|nr:hypothetical protein [Methanotrichaceae archaeon]